MGDGRSGSPRLVSTSLGFPASLCLSASTLRAISLGLVKNTVADDKHSRQRYACGRDD